jgi:hypothetical protein
MSYYSEWQSVLGAAGDSGPADERIRQYYRMETEAYEKMLHHYPETFRGLAADLAEQLGFGQDMVVFLGFLDGINPSLTTTLDLDAVADATAVILDPDYRKLFWRMNEAKADWLYGLRSWARVLTESERQQITREYRNSKIVHREKTGRNDPCPCGSGKKYKNCCSRRA